MEGGRRVLDISMRAIDAYKKTLLVDKVTADDDKSPPVYILEEISSILMSCPLDLTKEIVEYTFRRLRHRSPQVKYKVLRFIKYTVNRAASSAYRRELQSCSMAIRELFNYQGPVDPLRGNALNQAVRDAAEEAIKAIFSSDVGVESKNMRIEGFGNGSFSKPLATSYRSLVSDSLDPHNGVQSIHHRTNMGSFDSLSGKQDDMEGESFLCCNGSGRFYSPNCTEDYVEGPPLDGESPRQSQDRAQGKKDVSSEERLVNHVTAPSGSRLQPSKESLRSFLSSAKALDANRIASALKAKLKSHSWQVRLKAVCVLQAILLQKDDHLLRAVEAHEGDFEGLVRKCLQSPQTSLRGEAKEALDMLSSLKEKIHGRFLNNLVDNSSCDKPFVKVEGHNGGHMCAGSLKDSPALKPEYKVVDLLSFDNPFDGMHVYGSNDAAAIPVEDFLSDGYISSHTDVYSKNGPTMQTSSLSSVGLQYLAVQDRGNKTDMLDLNSLLDFTANMSTSIEKYTVPSLDNKTSRAQSIRNISSPRDFTAVCMHPQGGIGESLHTYSLI